MQLSIVIPCYNEERGLPSLVARCREVVAARTGVEVILVNNGSKDQSARVMAQELEGESHIRSVLVPDNLGYGYGVLAGVRSAVGEVVAWTHADLQTDPMDAIAGLKLFDDAADPTRLFVKGRRYGRPITDTVFTWGMSAYETLLFQKWIVDINAVPTMFHRSFCADWTFEGWEHPPHDFSLDLFAYLTAKKRGMMVKRIPVRFGRREHGVSSWNTNTWASKQKFIKRTLDYSRRLKSQISRSPGGS